MSGKEMGIGLLGFGIVGTGTWKVLQNQQEKISNSAGTTLKIKRILVRDKSKDRQIPEAVPLITDRFTDLLNDDNIHIVVDVMGGEEPALSYILDALEKGRHLVTANKEVMAKHGPLIYATAAAHQCRIYTEACVAGGIPLLYPLQECFSGSEIIRISGIINGTTNYILTKMDEEEKDYHEALKEAQDQGYAEADPAADVKGLDALYKTVLLIREAFGVQVDWERIPCEGIDRITAQDIQTARQWGYRIKLIGMAFKERNGICAAVQPVMIPDGHLLAAIRGVNNGVLVTGDAVGEILFAGPGAGQMPTGTAVVSDLVRLAKAVTDGSKYRPAVVHPGVVNDSGKGEYYLRWSSNSKIPDELLNNQLAVFGAQCLYFGQVSEQVSKPVYQARINGLTMSEKDVLIKNIQVSENINEKEIIALRMGLPLSEVQGDEISD